MLLTGLGHKNKCWLLCRPSWNPFSIKYLTKIYQSPTFSFLFPPLNPHKHKLESYARAQVLFGPYFPLDTFISFQGAFWALLPVNTYSAPSKLCMRMFFPCSQVLLILQRSKQSLFMRSEQGTSFLLSWPDIHHYKFHLSFQIPNFFIIPCLNMFSLPWSRRKYTEQIGTKPGQLLETLSYLDVSQ